VPGELVTAEWRLAEAGRGGAAGGRLEVGQVARRLSGGGAAARRRRLRALHFCSILRGRIEDENGSFHDRPL
jgi:hypothetical protein